MKVEQKKEFVPVEISLENPVELSTLIHALRFALSNKSFSFQDGVNSAIANTLLVRLDQCK